MEGAEENIDIRWKPDVRVLKKLEGSFFYQLAQLEPYKKCHAFQLFIKSCYEKEKHTFTFGRNKEFQLYFGLQDVSALSGMPVDGKAVICDDVDTKILCKRYLGTFDESACKSKKTEGKQKKGSPVKLYKSWLREKFEKVPDEAPEETLVYHVRAYLLHLIGTFILPDCDNPAIYKANWLELIKDINGLDRVAWGAAALCRLIKSLESGRLNPQGAWWLLELFFLERIPNIRKAFLGEVSPSQELVKDIPLHKYWIPKIANREKGKRGKSILMEQLKDIRDSMMPHDIILNPYDEYESYFDKRVFFSRVVLINFDDVVYHQPDLVCRQLRIENLKKLPPMISLKISLPRGSTERNYCQNYAQFIQMWNKRHSEDFCIQCESSSFYLPIELEEEQEESEGSGLRGMIDCISTMENVPMSPEELEHLRRGKEAIQNIFMPRS